jgi:RNase adaptor protein for sRNA GlmZ degradation
MVDVYLTAYGKKHGPLDTVVDLDFDATALRNPYSQHHLRDLWGNHAKVEDYVKGDPNWTRWFEGVRNEIAEAFNQTIRDRREELRVAVHCVGGRHRSVVAAYALLDAIYNWKIVGTEHTITLDMRERADYPASTFKGSENLSDKAG